MNKEQKEQESRYWKHSEVLARLRKAFGTENQDTKPEKNTEREDNKESTIEVTFFKKKPKA